VQIYAVLLFLCHLIPLIHAEPLSVSVEAVGGALTYHLIDDGASQLYVQKITRDGRLIFNPIYGANFIFESKESFFSIGGFAGQNSVGLPIQGGLISNGVKVANGHLYLGWAVGGYVQNDLAFRAKGVIPFKLFEFSHYRDFVPLIGIEIDLKFMLTNHFYFKIYELLTPILNVNTLALGVTI
jgi:hypothetical protein